MVITSGLSMSTAENYFFFLPYLESRKKKPPYEFQLA